MYLAREWVRAFVGPIVCWVTSLLSTESSVDRAAHRAAGATRLLALGDFRVIVVSTAGFTAAHRVVKLPAAREFRELRLIVGIFISSAGTIRAAET